MNRIKNTLNDKKMFEILKFEFTKNKLKHFKLMIIKIEDSMSVVSLGYAVYLLTNAAFRCFLKL